MIKQIILCSYLLFSYCTTVQVVAQCDFMSNQNIQFTASDVNTNDGYTTRYLLTDLDNKIIEISDSPSFEAQEKGCYQIYAVNYFDFNPILVGSNIADFDFTCFAITEALPISICDEVDWCVVVDCNQDPNVSTGLVSLVTNGVNTDTDYTTQYILTDIEGNIINISDQPSFMIPNEELYMVFAINYPVGSSPCGLEIGGFAQGITGMCVLLGDPILLVPDEETVSFSGVVWLDGDASGTNQVNELGVEDVAVQLIDADGIIVATVFTNDDGVYEFIDVAPGDYSLQFTTDLQPTLLNQGTNESIDSDGFFDTGFNTIITDVFTVDADAQLDIDLGVYELIDVGQYVWYDINENDIQDPWENGLNGMPVNIYILQNGVYVLYESAVTDHKPDTGSDDGYFKFRVPPGTYYLEVVMPPIGLVQAQPNVFSNLALTAVNEPVNDSDLTNSFGHGTSDAFTVMSGDDLCNFSAGYYEMASIGNRVWHDSNSNGIQESVESSLVDVLVEAIERETGEVVQSTISDENGMYAIQYLEKSEYYLKFTPPDGFVSTFANQGNDNEDSDVDGSYGVNTTTAYSTNPGITINNVDAGFFAGALPVVWKSIGVERINQHNILSWSVSRELMTSHYTIERKTGSELNFNPLARQDAEAKQGQEYSYTFIDDETIIADDYYYRIKQVDLDGQVSYSDIVTVNVKSTGPVLTVFPVPARDFVFVGVTLNSNNPATLVLYNSVGQIIKFQYLNKTSLTKHHFTFEDLPTGYYTCKLTQGSQTVIKKVIVSTP